MFMLSYDLRQIEHQLYGFDAALAATGVLDVHRAFNRDFTEFVHRTTGLSGSQGWATVLMDRFGAGWPAFDAFCRLLCDALPLQFNLDHFDYEGRPEATGQ